MRVSGMLGYTIMLYGLCLALVSCSGNKQEDARSLHIVTTTGIIGDALANIAGDSAKVTSLMGPGVDPHLYKATQGDLERLRSADVIVHNGLHLEGKMGEILENLGRQKPVISMSGGLPRDRLLSPPAYDPHIWFDVSLWRTAIEDVAEKLGTLFPGYAPYFRENTRRYLIELDTLHQWVGRRISTIPEDHRVLITAHDAFEYFGRAYDIEVRGLQGISTLSEFGLKDVTDMVDFISRRRIKAVFVESSVSGKSLQAVVEGVENRGHRIRIGGTLYSDAMGEKGSPEGTYTGMVRSNVETIVSALK